jgi:hypothetical protein
MKRTASFAFFVPILCAASLGWLAAAAAQTPAGNEAWAACLDHPARACILDEAETAARAIATEPMGGYALLRVAGMHARAGRPGKARDLLKSIGDGYFLGRLGVLRDIAQAESVPVPTAEMAAAYAGEIRRAEQQTKAAWRVQLLHDVAREATRAGMRAEAAAAYEQALRSAQTAKAAEKSADARFLDITAEAIDANLQSMAEERAQTGDSAIALAAATATGDPYKRARALLVAAGAQLKAGSKDEAGATLDTAVLAAREDLHKKRGLFLQPAKLLADIAAAQRAAGLDGKAAETFGEAEDAVTRMSPGHRDRGLALSYIAAAEKAAGLEEMAAASRDRMMTAARAVSDRWTRAMVLADAAATLAHAAQGREAADTFSEALELADGTGDPSFRAELFIGAAQARTGDTAGAHSTFQAALRAARQAALQAARSGPAVYGEPLLELAQAQMDAGLAEDARTVFAEWLEARFQRNDHRLWDGLRGLRTSRLLATVELPDLQWLLGAVLALGNPRLRAEMLRVLAEVAPER